MKIHYFGHSCFRLESDAGTSIVTDPFGGIGFELPAGLRADAVTVSHGHYDHCRVNAVGGSPAVYDRAGRYALGDISFEAVESYHDDAQGRKRGKNLIFRFQIDGLTVCHLGDLGEEPTATRVASIAPADVLLIPVGGVYTIDAAAAREYVGRIKPAAVIPMHYQTADLNMRLGSVEAFTGLFSGREAEICPAGSEIEWKSGSSDRIKIFVMERSRTWN